MNSIQFLVGKRYDIEYLVKQKQNKRYDFNKKDKSITILTKLNNVMFYKSTPCYFVFWTGSSCIKISKETIKSYYEK